MAEKIIGFVPKLAKEKDEIKKISDECFNNFKQLYESGEIKEFLIIGIDSDNRAFIQGGCTDYLSSIGLIEMGKQIMFDQVGD